MDKAAFLSLGKPKVTKIELGQGVVFLRESTIADNNYMLQERRVYLIEQAKLLGIELDLSSDVELESQLKLVPDKYMLARNAAMRLCDEQGALLFDMNNVEDLEALNGLSQDLLQAIYLDDAKKKGLLK